MFKLFNVKYFYDMIMITTDFTSINSSRIEDLK